mgnify:FL=1
MLLNHRVKYATALRLRSADNTSLSGRRFHFDSSSIVFVPSGRLFCSTISRYLPTLFDISEEYPLATFGSAREGDLGYKNACTIKVCSPLSDARTPTEIVRSMETLVGVRSLCTTQPDQTTSMHTSGPCPRSRSLRRAAKTPSHAPRSSPKILPSVRTLHTTPFHLQANTTSQLSIAGWILIVTLPSIRARRVPSFRSTSRSHPPCSQVIGNIRSSWFDTPELTRERARSIVNTALFHPSLPLVFTSGVEKVILVHSPSPFANSNDHPPFIPRKRNPNAPPNEDLRGSEEEDLGCLEYFDTLLARDEARWSSFVDGKAPPESVSDDGSDEFEDDEALLALQMGDSDDSGAGSDEDQGHAQGDGSDDGWGTQDSDSGVDEEDLIALGAAPDELG